MLILIYFFGLLVIANGQLDFHLLTNDPIKDWWQTASFYQIYPRSFKDSNGDGIGDLNGIIEKLPYLKELGITAVWMSPIFKSPMADFGYDISNFYDIQPEYAREYGTIADFDNLIVNAKKINLKIILDFVPNHSSDENDWFQKSIDNDPNYSDYYVWHPGFPDSKNSTNRLPPNNWISVFHGSAWEYNSKRKAFYLHQFAVKQPDLNYRNPKVVNQMKDVLKFWLNRGVDGFRIDAVPHLFEVLPDKNGNYPDEPLSGNTNDKNDWNYLNHIYTKDQSETIDMVYQWRQVMDQFKKENGGETRVIMTESYSPIDIVMKYYGNATTEGANMPFNFQLLEQLNNGSSANDYKSAIDFWLTNMPPGRTSNWVVGNHDQNRVASRLGSDRVDAINMMVLTLPGASVTYNGEEIGMTDVWISWADTVDPAACNTNPSIYEKFSRDPERTPFQWDDSLSAGFSSNPKTWLPIASDYKTNNVKLQKSIENSHLKIYWDLIKLRYSKTMKFGDLITKALNNNVLAILRYYANESAYVTIVNIGSSNETVNLNDIKSVPLTWEYLIVGINSKHKTGEKLDSSNVVLNAKECMVLKSLEPISSQGKDFYKYRVQEL